MWASFVAAQRLFLNETMLCDSEYSQCQSSMFAKSVAGTTSKELQRTAPIQSLEQGLVMAFGRFLGLFNASDQNACLQLSPRSCPESAVFSHAVTGPFMYALYCLKVSNFEFNGPAPPAPVALSMQAAEDCDAVSALSRCHPAVRESLTHRSREGGR